MVALVLGAIVGLVVGDPAGQLKPLGDILVRLLQMVVIPIIFLTLVMAMRRIQPSRLGRLGVQTVVLYIITTAIAVVVGLAVANLINPGIGVTIPSGIEASQKSAPNLLEVLLNIFPENPINAMAQGNVLGVIFFALVFGIGLALVQEEAEEGSVVYNGATSLFEIVEAAANTMFKIVWGIIEYAVIGVFALMAWAFGSTGPGLILSFGKLILALGVAIIIQISVTYLFGIIVLSLRKSPRDFLSGAREAMTTAFAIRSSSGTLPVTMTNARENFKIDEGVYSFTLPLEPV